MTTLIIISLTIIYLIIGRVVAEKCEDWGDDDPYFYESLILIITIF